MILQCSTPSIFLFQSSSFNLPPSIFHFPVSCSTYPSSISSFGRDLTRNTRTRKKGSRKNQTHTLGAAAVQRLFSKQRLFRAAAGKAREMSKGKVAAGGREAMAKYGHWAAVSLQPPLLTVMGAGVKTGGPTPPIARQVEEEVEGEGEEEGGE